MKSTFQTTLLLILFFIKSFSQITPTEALKKFQSAFPQEKVYLWMNKSAYIAGETIMFKAFVFTQYEILNISTTLYVELYNSEKKILSTKLYPVQFGSAQGSIELDNKLSEDVYYVRAYTRWMQNFNEAFQFIKPVPVYNPGSQKQLQLKKSDWIAKAIPEGGSLVAGLESRVAIRLFSASNLPDRWYGYVYEKNNPSEKIETFESLDKNAALFSFTPEDQKEYLVFVNDEAGNKQIVALPVIKNSGVAISVESELDSVSVKLRFQNIKDNGKGYSIIGDIQQQLVYNANVINSSNNVSFKIPVSNPPNGILHFTVFNTLNEPEVERLVFLNHSGLNFDSSVIDQFNPITDSRAKNELTINVDSINWTSYALSVTDAEMESSLKDENMLSYLWLSSDLINPVQSPASYFNQPDSNKIKALDAILISEKWNRFNWNELLKNNFPVIQYFPHNYLSYNGTVKKGNKLKPNEEVNLLLYFPDSSFQIMQSQTDNAGNLVVDNLVFTDELKIYYQSNTKKSNAKYIDIGFERNNRFLPYSLPLPESAYTLVSIETSKSRPDWVARSVKSLQVEKAFDERYKSLQEVIIRSKRKTAKEELNEKLSSGAFRSINETVFDFINEQQNASGYSNILSWLQGRVAGLQIQTNSTGELVPVIRASAATVVVDEMIVSPGLLSAFSINDIAMVKVMKGAVFGLAFGGGGGVIAIYTNRGNLKSVNTQPSLPGSTIKGYDVMKRFYSPEYTDKFISQTGTDTRDQLLWEPMLAPAEENDKSRVSFYNNDKTKSYRVIVQGYNNNGIPVYFEKIISSSPKSF